MAFGCEPPDRDHAEGQAPEEAAAPANEATAPTDEAVPRADSADQPNGGQPDDTANRDDQASTDKSAEPPSPDADKQAADEAEPIDLEARLNELREMRDRGMIAEALRQARLLRGELRTLTQRQKLKPLLDELRAMDRRASRLQPAIERLDDDTAMARVGQDMLEDGGRTAVVLLARAVREEPQPLALEAAETLRSIDPSAAASAIHERVRASTSSDAKLRWLRAIKPVTGKLDAEAAGQFYAAFGQATGPLKRAYLAALDRYVEEAHQGDEAAFNEAVDHDDAFATLESYVRTLDESGDPQLLRWVRQNLSAFQTFPRRGLVLHLAPGDKQHLQVTEDQRLRGWPDATGNGYSAEAPDTARQPRWIADATPSFARFDGSDDRLAIRELTFGGDRRIEAITVMVWFRTDSGDHISLVDFDRSETFCFGISFSGGPAGRLCWNTTDRANHTDDMSGETRIDDGGWHVGVAVYDAESQTKRIYVDGKLDAERGAHAGRPLGTGERFGFVGDGSEASTFNGRSNDSHFPGDIAEVAIWDRALHPREIEQVSARRTADAER